MKNLLLLLLAFSLGGPSSHIACAQTLSIRPAAELVFPLESGKAYQMFQSPDLSAWQPLGLPVFGSSAHSQLVSASSAARFFRIETNPLVNLNSTLQGLLNRHKVPALACAVIRSNRLVGVGVAGLRKAGITTAPVTLSDKWHHGSLTKSMTATLAAILVQEGQISWTNTLADRFPDFTNRMHAGWQEATLEWLTANRGGAPELIPAATWSDIWAFGRTPREGRRYLMERMTTNPPASTPGTRYEYSNTGFALAGHMLETAMNQPWEELLDQRLFRPLGMTSAGFGVPATPRHLDHPWGHTLPNPSLPPGTGNALTPVTPGESADNPPAIGPAATAHCSITDLAAYAAGQTHLNPQ
jgi:CubicO group peptidase (beta-lactamase class C family)